MRLRAILTDIRACSLCVLLTSCRVVRFSGKASGEEKEREKERAELSYLLFSEMQSEGVQPNLKLFNSLIELSGFEELRRRASVVDSTTHNVDGDRSAALGEEEFRQKVLSILTEMRRLGIRPNTKTLKWYSSLLSNIS